MSTGDVRTVLPSDKAMRSQEPPQASTQGAGGCRQGVRVEKKHGVEGSPCSMPPLVAQGSHENVVQGA